MYNIQKTTHFDVFYAMIFTCKNENQAIGGFEGVLHYHKINILYNV